MKNEDSKTIEERLKTSAIVSRAVRAALVEIAEKYKEKPKGEYLADLLKDWAKDKYAEDVHAWTVRSIKESGFSNGIEFCNSDHELNMSWNKADMELLKFIGENRLVEYNEAAKKEEGPAEEGRIYIPPGPRMAFILGSYHFLTEWITDPPPRWLKLYLAPWVEEEAERLDKLETERAGAAPLVVRPKSKTKSGKWTPIPRALDVAAALGGPLSVDMNGERYLPEPHLAGESVARALNPRALEIVPEDWLDGGRQMSLALDLETPAEALNEYMGAVVENAAKTAHLARFPNLCPKLLGYMFATAPMTGRGVRGKLGDIALDLYPDWKSNRRSTRDLEGIGSAFVAIKSLRLLESEADGTLRPYDLFILDYALSANPEKEIGWRVNPWLAERMQGGRRGGYFLVNMTRWLALGIQNPILFPLALRLAAKWDAARVGGIYNPARLQWIEADRLAYECNALSETAAAYRFQKQGSGKAQLQRARERLEANLAALENAGLCGPSELKRKHGKGYLILPKPPEDYAEACKRAARAAKTRKSPEA